MINSTASEARRSKDQILFKNALRIYFTIFQRSRPHCFAFFVYFDMMVCTQSLELCVANHLFAEFLSDSSTNSIYSTVKVSPSGNLKRHFLNKDRFWKTIASVAFIDT